MFLTVIPQTQTVSFKGGILNDEKVLWSHWDEYLFIRVNVLYLSDTKLHQDLLLSTSKTNMTMIQ